LVGKNYSLIYHLLYLNILHCEIQPHLWMAFFTCVWYASQQRAIESMERTKDSSPLPLTDPCDAVPHAHHAVHRCRRTVW